MLKTLWLITCAGLFSISLLASPAKNMDFDHKIIEVQKKMISANKNFKIKNITILNKKKIDKKWIMYTFNLNLFDKRQNRDFITPMIIFTDGKFETNSLTDIKTGVRYEILEQRRLADASKSKQQAKREAFENSFVLDKKYYNINHLVLGSMNAKNKVIMVSDPLCVACIGTFPSIYYSIKNNKDFALFMYEYPLNIHPTSSIVVKAMKLAKQQGVKNVEEKIYIANFDKKYNVYKNMDKKLALKTANKVLGTNFKISDLNKISIEDGRQIAQHIHLLGTPSIVFNGSISNSREKLAKALR